jgi:hypothetical protein
MEHIHLDEETSFNPETGEFGQLPRVVLFNADKYVISDEHPVFISWHVVHAEKVWLNNEPVDAQGSLEVHAMEPKTFTIRAENPFGSIDPVALTIDVDRSPPVIRSFKSSHQMAVVGSHIDLSWELTGAHRLTLNGEDVSANIGHVRSVQNSSGSFILKAYNYFGDEAETSLYVAVVPVPIIKTLIVPTPEFSQVKHFRMPKPSDFEVNLSVQVHPDCFQTVPIEPIRLDEKVFKTVFAKKGIRSRLGNLFDAFYRKFSRSPDTDDS